jgi:hypothetical protein
MILEAQRSCPNCGSEMEPINVPVDDLALQVLALDRLRLCPRCYLVVWNDEKGIQVRHGAPVLQPGAFSSRLKKGEC